VRPHLSPTLRSISQPSTHHTETSPHHHFTTTLPDHRESVSTGTTALIQHPAAGNTCRISSEQPSLPLSHLTELFHLLGAGDSTLVRDPSRNPGPLVPRARTAVADIIIRHPLAQRPLPTTLSVGQAATVTTRQRSQAPRPDRERETATTGEGIHTTTSYHRDEELAEKKGRKEKVQERSKQTKCAPGATPTTTVRTISPLRPLASACG
jgi:hypothetical protein